VRAAASASRPTDRRAAPPADPAPAPAPQYAAPAPARLALPARRAAVPRSHAADGAALPARHRPSRPEQYGPNRGSRIRACHLLMISRPPPRRCPTGPGR
jgi:hypothetical protein